MAPSLLYETFVCVVIQIVILLCIVSGSDILIWLRCWDIQMM